MVMHVIVNLGYDMINKNPVVPLLYHGFIYFSIILSFLSFHIYTVALSRSLSVFLIYKPMIKVKKSQWCS